MKEFNIEALNRKFKHQRIPKGIVSGLNGKIRSNSTLSDFLDIELVNIKGIDGYVINFSFNKDKIPFYFFAVSDDDLGDEPKWSLPKAKNNEYKELFKYVTRIADGITTNYFRRGGV